MKLVDSSTKLRFFILFLGLILIYLLPDGSWRRIAAYMVITLLSFITTITNLAYSKDGVLASAQNIYHVLSTLSIIVILIMNILGAVASPIQPLMLAASLVLLGIQALIR